MDKNALDGTCGDEILSNYAQQFLSNSEGEIMILPSAIEAEMKNGVTYKRTCTILTCSNTNPCCYFLKVLKMLLFFKSVDF